MHAHENSKGGKILRATEEPHAAIHKQDQFAVLERDVEKNMSPRNHRGIPCLNNPYSRLMLPVSFNAKHSEVTGKKSPAPKCLVFLMPSIPHSWCRGTTGDVVLTTDTSFYRFRRDSEKLGCVGHVNSGKTELQSFWTFTSWTRR